MSKKAKDRTAKQAAFRARAKTKAAAARPQPSPARNVHKEPGRPIAVRDVAPYARPGCPKCRGKGMVGYRKVGATRGAEPCKCATTRFWKAHPEIIVNEQGVAHWPAGEAPEQLAALKEARKSIENGNARTALDLEAARRPDALDQVFSDPRQRSAPVCTNGAPFHEDPDNTGWCTVCGAIVDLDEDRPVGGGTVVHHLHGGLTACPYSREHGVPGDWPKGQRWTPRPEQVNCQGCLDILAVREAIPG